MRRRMIVVALMTVAAIQVVQAQAIAVRFQHAETALAVRRAVDGAARRLKIHECESLLVLFHDQSGRSLSVNLPPSLGLIDYLRAVRFIDGSGNARCASRDVLAFAIPLVHIVYVCARRFAEVSRATPAYADVIVIHELLHTLGLGENPPASQEITAAVISRCSQ